MANQNRIKAVTLTVLTILVFVGALWADSTPKKPARDPLLGMIPSESLFCVRVNNLKGTLGSMEGFLESLVPLPFKLTGFLEGQEWKDVNTDGDSALFGMVIQSDSPNANPLADLFVGALLSVTEYNKVIRGNPDISKADENGISKAGEHGPLITRLGKYALICRRNDYDKLVKVKSMAGPRKRGLRSVLDAPEIRRAANEPIWAYANIQLVGKTFGPLVMGKLEEVKKMFEQMDKTQRGPMENPGAIMDMYAEILKVLADEVQYVSVALRPTADVLNVTKTIASRDGTKLAHAFVAAGRKGQRNKLLGYLEDGAIMNFACRINAPFLENTYVRSLDLIGWLGGGMSEEDITKLKAMMVDELAAMGENLAFSFLTEDKKPPFAFKYVVQISNEKKFNKALNEQIEMMNSGAFADIYKNMGMKINMEIKRGATKYKGVSIDSAKLTFQSTEPDSQQGKMIEAMYGDGFDYRWALVEGHAVYVVGGDVDTQIRALIDQVKAGGPKKLGTEVKSALAMLEGRGRTDFVGTFNYVRLLKMVAAMMQDLPMPGAGMPRIDMVSKSNVAFAGNVRNGKLTARAALPKEHLKELVAVFGMMQQKMAEQRKQAESKADKAGFVPLFNGRDLTGWEPSGGAKWVVKDGLLIGTQGENNAPGDLFTRADYKDFDLRCTYRVEWPCNTGIWFRYQSPRKTYQADILEYKNPVCYSGSLYCPGKMFIAMNEDKSLVDREGWNTMRVRAEGDHIQIWINDHKVADVHDDSTDSGKIGFQVHPGAQFGPMKIVVRELLLKAL